MSYKKGFRNAVKKQGYNAPKRDGILGTSLCESEGSKKKAENYSKGYSNGDKARKKSMNLIQRFFD